MATRWAVANGNWSDPATWDGGTLPGAADDVYADGKTVTIDMSATVTTLRISQRSGGTAYGRFYLKSGCTLTLLSSLMGLLNTIGSTTSVVTYAENSGSATIVGVFDQRYASYQMLIWVTGTGTLNIVGPITAGTATSVLSFISITAAATVNFTGNIIGGGPGSGSSFGVYIQAPAIVYITGEILGGSAAFAVNSAIQATITVVGPCTASGVAAISSNAASTITVTGTLTASSSAPALSSSHISAVNKLSGPFINVEGTMAVYAQKMYLTDTTANRWEFTTDVGTQRNLYSADTLGGNPVVADVRLHTTYGPANELTGVCAVPPAESVSYGVPVDQTTGTALLDAAAIASALNASTLAADVGTLQSDVSEISARILEQAPEEGPAVVIPSPSEPTMTTAYIYCFDEHGLPEEGVIIQIRLRALGTGLDGLAFDTARIEAVSNSDGLATAEIPRGASLQFQARRGTTGSWTTFTGANTETLELPALLGHE